MRRGWIGIFAAALGLLWSSGLAAAACTKPHHHRIGSGALPSGAGWTVTAGIKNNGASETAFVGYTGVEGTEVVATLADGSTFTVKPRLAPAALRKKVVWLRGFRFFVYFHPSRPRIEQVAVYTRGGRLIYRAKGIAGGFF